MDYTYINKAIEKALQRKHPVSKSGEASGNELDSGEYDEIIEVYATEQPNIFVKLILRTNSYGTDESIHSITFVKSIAKTVTDYIPL